MSTPADLEALARRYQPKANGFTYQPSAEIMWRDMLIVLAENERLVDERNATANAARTQANALQAGSDQILADIRTIRARLHAVGWCDSCLPIAKAAFDDLGPLLETRPTT